MNNGWVIYAEKAWNILINNAKKKELITYKDLANKIGLVPSSTAYPLGIIQDYCLEKDLPPLTILVVNRNGNLGKGFFAWDVRDQEAGKTKVNNYTWDLLDNPFFSNSDDVTEDTLIQNLLQVPEKSVEVYSKIKNRGIAQMIFRKALLIAYDNKCAFTGLSYVEGLEAAHIVPWAKATEIQRLDVRNGILINAFHHKLFDSGFIKINENYEIIYDESDYRSTTEYDKILIDNICGKKINLPKDKKHYPLIDNIKQMNNFN